MTSNAIRRGGKFGKWVAWKSVAGPGHPQWLCICTCGVTKVVNRYDLLTGKSTSCTRCARAGERNGRHSHGGRYERLYMVWLAIKQRCGNPNHKSFEYYGGRGITVHSAWRDSFAVFRAAVDKLGPWPGTGYSIDRKNNDKGYQPGNIKWSTQKEQVANSRRRKKD